MLVSGSMIRKTAKECKCMQMVVAMRGNINKTNATAMGNLQLIMVESFKARIIKEN